MREVVERNYPAINGGARGKKKNEQQRKKGGGGAGRSNKTQAAGDQRVFRPPESTLRMQPGGDLISIGPDNSRRTCLSPLRDQELSAATGWMRFCERLGAGKGRLGSTRHARQRIPATCSRNFWRGRERNGSRASPEGVQPAALAGDSHQDQARPGITGVVVEIRRFLASAALERRFITRQGGEFVHPAIPVPLFLFFPSGA
ncbi:hypothetical protein B0T11DRAFT_285488 [Plectosphaerella cucumerina]|uniref:Uncharacterized protein n=1 Tax=Plectosphaerella cucumerina TaxID=40658 RepID=A0A8K0TE81_9PEZI|nr:hypothetical protein B0T11DRAFT_285488 [Plectosphaerella cucumerina]